MRILLVDDSSTMRNISKRVLTGLGYTDILEAADGKDALSKAVTYNPELVLLDWNMPVMDGLTFVKTFRARGNKVPVIMVTTEAEKAKVIEAIRAGVNNYVSKPFTPELLRKRIEETVGPRQVAA